MKLTVNVDNGYLENVDARDRKLFVNCLEESLQKQFKEYKVSLKKVDQVQPFTVEGKKPKNFEARVQQAEDKAWDKWQDKVVAKIVTFKQFALAY